MTRLAGSGRRPNDPDRMRHLLAKARAGTLTARENSEAGIVDETDPLGSV